MLRAILLCSFHFWIAIARIKLPINRKTYLCPNAAVVVFISNPPERGKIIIGSNEVAAIGIGSVIHQIAIQEVQAKIAFP